ncbi:MAG: type II toxin-antitoxin system VapC family toxin [Ilumatobacteraceae bacterium]
MIVLDASVLANLVGDDGHAGRLARSRAAQATRLTAPDLVDVETVAVLRRRWRAGDLTARRFRAAIDDLLALPIDRFPTGALMIRAYDLRANVTPYDAAYVALAETLDCSLVTADARLSRAPGLRCRVEVLAL